MTTVKEMKHLVGQLIRNGRPVFYAYINGKKVERMSLCSIHNALMIASMEGKRLGA